MMKMDGYKHTLVVLLFSIVASVVSSAQIFKTLVNFDGNDGFGPDSPLVQGFNGNLYGETTYASSSAGTVFKMTPKHALTTIHGFDFGGQPESGLALGTDGNFYGTTGYGGANEGGTAFKITPTGQLTTIYNFCSQSGCPDGEEPFSPLIQSVAGEFYGTTLSGGVYGEGTVFKLTKSGNLTTLYSFCTQPGCADGANPFAGLVQAANGDFYGTTEVGGNPGCTIQGGCGTVFKITANGTLMTLYKFCEQANCADGTLPIAGLVQGIDGSLYGTTYIGGNPGCSFGEGCGTVFKITPKGTLTTLYSFCAQANCADGGVPIAGLAQASDGTFYGTTSQGGSNGEGTLFTIDSEGALTTLYSFACGECRTGVFPGALMQATNGSFYGTTGSGGTAGGRKCDNQGCGTIYSLDMGLGPFVAFVRGAGKVEQPFGILGKGFTETASVFVNGTSASFTVVSDTLIKAIVPVGATTGYVTVTTPSGTLTSNVPFHVIP